MPLFYGGAVPMHRQLKGLLLPGLPRGQIPAGRQGEGLRLSLPFAAFPQLFPRHPDRERA
jgi:hypothetical protein